MQLCTCRYCTFCHKNGALLFLVKMCCRWFIILQRFWSTLEVAKLVMSCILGSDIPKGRSKTNLF
uniref:Uncharacterized protein n=1 Tax=Aegilops tauschii subsp. strangulata TaxID=200361 RepID=A0A453RMB1_AEGTS